MRSRSKFQHIVCWSFEAEDGREIEVELWGVPTPGERATFDDPGCDPGIDDLTLFAMDHGGDRAHEIHPDEELYQDAYAYAAEWIALSPSGDY